MAIHIPRLFFLGVAGRDWSIGGFSTPPECRSGGKLSSANRLLWRHAPLLFGWIADFRQGECLMPLDVQSKF
jgi:hypothetical protein